MPASFKAETIWVLAIVSLVQCGDAQTLTNGMPRSEVLTILGKPQGSVSAGKTETLLYSGGTVDLANDKVTDFALRGHVPATKVRSSQSTQRLPATKTVQMASQPTSAVTTEHAEESAILSGQAVWATGTERVDEEGFSYVAPSGWSVQPHPRPDVSKCKVVTGPRVEGYPLNMNAVRTVFFAGMVSHETVVNQQIEAMQKRISGFRLLSKNAFPADRGLVGYRVVYLARLDGVDFRLLMYSFLRKQMRMIGQSKSRYECVTITCDAPAATSGHYDGLYDQSMRSFKFTLLPR